MQSVRLGGARPRFDDRNPIKYGGLVSVACVGRSGRGLPDLGAELLQWKSSVEFGGGAVVKMSTLVFGMVGARTLIDRHAIGDL